MLPTEWNLQCTRLAYLSPCHRAGKTMKEMVPFLHGHCHHPHPFPTISIYGPEINKNLQIKASEFWHNKLGARCLTLQLPERLSFAERLRWNVELFCQRRDSALEIRWLHHGRWPWGLPSSAPGQRDLHPVYSIERYQRQEAGLRPTPGANLLSMTKLLVLELLGFQSVTFKEGSPPQGKLQRSFTKHSSSYK
jgi:hypothetical protein